MKTFRPSFRKSCSGFSLIEASFSVTILSFGILSLAPLLGLGLNTARQARDRQVASQIAETLTEEAREGTLTAGSASFDDQGAPCPKESGCYRTTTIETALSGNCTRLIIAIAPVNALKRPFHYAVVLSRS